jgi:SAM-dependent methyltransferase
MEDLEAQFGQIDIYLFDQLLRGRVRQGMVILDAGSGAGRNLVYFLRSGYHVFSTDADVESIGRVRRLAARLAPALPAENFRVERIERTSFPDAFFDVVISSAVLHFARDEAHFDAMVREMWRVLKPGGLFFCRLASDIGIERSLVQIDHRRFRLPDGTEWFLVDEPMLMALTGSLGGVLLDPIKTTNVQNQRCMTTWVVRKAKAPGSTDSDVRDERQVIGRHE